MHFVGYVVAALAFAGVAVWLYLRLEEVIEGKLPKITHDLLRFLKRKGTKEESHTPAEIEWLREVVEAAAGMPISERQLEQEIRRDFPDDPLANLLLVVLRRLRETQSAVEKLEAKLKELEPRDEESSEIVKKVESILAAGAEKKHLI